MPTKHSLAVCAIVRNDAGQVLLVKCRDRQDTWEPPGGVVEQGEDIFAAARREVQEEAGIDIEPEAIAGLFHNVTSAVFSVALTARAVGGVPRAAGETVDAGFFPPEESLRRITRAQLRQRVADALAQPGKLVYRSYERSPVKWLVEHVQ